MNESRRDSDRVVLAATIILAVISVAMYLTVFLTLAHFGMLNDNGRALALVALVISAISMLLACYQAMAGRNRALTSSGMSGAGWILICSGVITGAPALGLEMSATGGSFGGVPAAMFLVIAGAAILQAERNVRQSNDRGSA